MDLECVYVDPPRASVPGDERLLRLEANVGKLLEIMQKGSEPAPAPSHPSPPQAVAPGLETLSQLAASPLPGEAFWLSPPFNSAVAPTFFDTLVSAATEVSPQVEPSISPHTKTPASLHDEYSATQARPIPRAGAGSRMAAFTEPGAHEAPFRPLTYNPDTFRNAEIDGGPVVGGTPKRGRGDPLDRGIFSEGEARALFDL
jgi:hypothetical protein